MLTRFELTVIARAQLTDRELLKRALAVEAGMEELATELGIDSDRAGLAGLGSGIDAQLCRANPKRRGAIAAETLRTEGAPEDVIEAVSSARHGAPARLSSLAAALLVADVLVAAAYEQLAEPAGGLDELTGRGLALMVERAAARSEDRGTESEEKRAREAAAHIGLSMMRAGELVLTGMTRIRADLGL